MRIFVSKREEVAGGWRIMYEELHNLCMSPNIIRVMKSRRMRWAEHVARMGDMRNAYKVLVGKHEWKRPHRRTGGRWEGNIKSRSQENRVGCCGFIWLRIGTSAGPL
jgi:hypothetical protein